MRRQINPSLPIIARNAIILTMPQDDYNSLALSAVVLFLTTHSPALAGAPSQPPSQLSIVLTVVVVYVLSLE